MNPPFSAMANVAGRMADAAYRHIASALARLADGGRLVAITGANFGPDTPAWRDAFVRLQERGRIVFTAAIDGSVYAKHGTTIETRLTVIDEAPAENPAAFPASRGIAPDVATLLGWIGEHVPPPAAATPAIPVSAAAPSRHRANRPQLSARAAAAPARHSVPNRRRSNSPMRPSTGRRPRAPASPMRSMKNTDSSRSGFPALRRIPPSWCNRRRWPRSRRPSQAIGRTCPPMSSRRLLSDAQLESVINAGEAHCGHLAGSWTVDETFDIVSAAPDERRTPSASAAAGFSATAPAPARAASRRHPARQLAEGPPPRGLGVEIRQADRGRPARLVGARQERLLVTPLSRFRQGTPIRLEQGVLFTTYATLRSDARDEKVSRVRQIVEWLGSDFDGVIIFDESHAMQNAAGGKGERGDQAASQQGRAGFRLSTRCRTRASSMSRRPAPPPSTISPMPSGSASGAARISPSPRGPSSSRRSRPAVSRPWRSWRAT